MIHAVENAVEKVFIVEDDAAICAGLGDLLESAGFTTRIFSSAEAFLAGWNSSMPGCLVLDVRLPAMSGMELQGVLGESSIPVIVMTAHGDMPMVRKALKAGATEFLIKPFQDEELLQAVAHAFQVDRERRRADTLLQTIQSRMETLTDREREVMAFVVAGWTNKEIAEKIFLSVVTVKLHRGQVMRKMQADSLADLVKMSERIKPVHGTRELNK